eukprot:CAMPEP_0178439266 /NCGR_PEP_ID=MMETSP0689_2-20121128/36064_1 /TAXON_ID=160604 /ORGANISM="Amphidinium massartii, Strain CS-259" /LENGTH=122 /DNA_ID=CAMNT_0020061783 /DNA_START=63 /DNA_END=428 /DNA_ORIENTATION=+
MTSDSMAQALQTFPVVAILCMLGMMLVRALLSSSAFHLVNKAGDLELPLTVQHTNCQTSSQPTSDDSSCGNNTQQQEAEPVEKDTDEEGRVLNAYGKPGTMDTAESFDDLLQWAASDCDGED